jgi:hypothetical protein
MTQCPKLFIIIRYKLRSATEGRVICEEYDDSFQVAGAFRGREVAGGTQGREVAGGTQGREVAGGTWGGAVTRGGARNALAGGTRRPRGGDTRDDGSHPGAAGRREESGSRERREASGAARSYAEKIRICRI